MSDWPSAARATRDAASNWFELLDGRIVGQADSSWKVRVYCAMPEATCIWIQLALVGASTHNLLLRVGPPADAADSLWALEQWLAGRETSTDRVIDVSPAPAGEPAMLQTRRAAG